MLPVFAWERALQGWMAHVSRPVLRPLRWLNIALADEGLVTLAIPLLLLVRPRWPMLVAVVAIVASPRIEDWAKALVGRGRPRNEYEPGFPSGDCAMVTIWASVLLGWWAAVPIALVAWARVASGAHWPLDTLGGVALGLWLVSPALVWAWRG